MDPLGILYIKPLKARLHARFFDRIADVSLPADEESRSA